MVPITRGRFLESHWTPDLCLKESCDAAAYRVTVCVCARFSRMNHICIVFEWVDDDAVYPVTAYPLEE